MARDPRAAGGAGEGEMGGEAAIREADGSPFFQLVAPRERDRRDRCGGRAPAKLAVEVRVARAIPWSLVRYTGSYLMI